MSTFSRTIERFPELRNSFESNPFLKKVSQELIAKGEAFLAIRNNNATVYYKGGQLCNLQFTKNYEPTIYNLYLPIVRSRTLQEPLKKKPFTEKDWLGEAEISSKNFSDVFNEILNNVEKESSPEGKQVSELYRFSPLNKDITSKISLLDVEAVFAESGKKIDTTDIIDLVFYHKEENRLMFVEVKRLNDERLKDKKGKAAEIFKQMEQYRKRIYNEKEKIREQYNNVIDYYNEFGNLSLPLVSDAEPLLGLLLVEFSESDSEKRKETKNRLKDKGIKVYEIGNTSNIKKETLDAMYKRFK